MNTRMSGWVRLALARIGAGAVPVDGSYGLGLQKAPHRTPANAAPARRRAGQIQFVRGLS